MSKLKSLVLVLIYIILISCSSNSSSSNSNSDLYLDLSCYENGNSTNGSGNYISINCNNYPLIVSEELNQIINVEIQPTLNEERNRNWHVESTAIQLIINNSDLTSFQLSSTNNNCVANEGIFNNDLNKYDIDLSKPCNFSFQSNSGRINYSIVPIYIIKNVQDFENINENEKNYNLNQNYQNHYKLVNDLKLASSNSSYINMFYGDFNGNNKSIKNIHITSSQDNIGLFGEVLGNGTIYSLNIEINKIEGNEKVGGLVGYFHTNTNSNVKDIVVDIQNEITARTFVGGLIGKGEKIKLENINIKSTNSIGNIKSTETSNSNSGGIIGDIIGEIKSSNVNIIINSAGSNTGGLAGRGVGNIEDSNSDGKIILLGDNTGVGGLIGKLEGNITNSNSKIIVQGSTDRFSYDIGGLVGHQSSGLISNSFVTGDVTGYNTVGGLVGNQYGDIELSYSTGKVIGVEKVGGLVGIQELNKTITTSYFTGEVTAGEKTGGLVGESRGIIKSSYSQGIVTGTNKVGGLVGNNTNGIIEYSYFKGEVIGDEVVGGVIGDNQVNLKNVFFIGDIEGENYVGGIVGKLSADLAYSYSLPNITSEGEKVDMMFGGYESGIIDRSYSVGNLNTILVGNYIEIPTNDIDQLTEINVTSNFTIFDGRPNLWNRTIIGVTYQFPLLVFNENYWLLEEDKWYNPQITQRSPN